MDQSSSQTPTPSPARKSPLNHVLLALLIIITANWLWNSWRDREFRFLGSVVKFKSSVFVFPRGDTKLYFWSSVVKTDKNEPFGFISGKEVEWTFWNNEEYTVEFEFPEQVFICEDSRGYTGTDRVAEELQNQKFTISPNEKKTLRFKWDRLLVSDAKRGELPIWFRFYPLIKVGGQSVVYASPTGDNVRRASP